MVMSLPHGSTLAMWMTTRPALCIRMEAEVLFEPCPVRALDVTLDVTLDAVRRRTDQTEPCRRRRVVQSGDPAEHQSFLESL